MLEIFILFLSISPAFGFFFLGPLNAQRNISLRIALTQSDPDGLIDALYDTSTPGSANYGKHLSKEQVEAFVAPTNETSNAVSTWLAGHGINATKSTPAGDWLSIDVTVEKASQLLNTNFSIFNQSDSEAEFIRSFSSAIPISLKEHVLLVHPILPSTGSTDNATPVFTTPNISSLSRRALPPGLPAECLQVSAPPCLQFLYNIPSTPATQKSNVLGVSGFRNQSANQADLSAFLQLTRPDISPNTTFKVATLDGAVITQNQSLAGSEPDLDIQYTVGLATNVPVEYISVGTDNQDGLSGFLDIIQFLLRQDHPPRVLTTSAGFSEESVTPALQKQICNAYAQLTARGTSILFASGDGGVSGPRSQNCTSFIATFPSNCPFVTSVGSTQGNPFPTETAASFSGGGFSTVFPQPLYQTLAVSKYLAKLSQTNQTNKGLFNPKGRAFPDVAAFGVECVVVVKGEVSAISGASCSSPIFASVVALVNDRLISRGRPPLGFLNPLLYALGSGAFNDITTGSNPGCGTDGFPAMSGWDPVTGLGTPNFTKLMAALGLH